MSPSLYCGRFASRCYKTWQRNGSITSYAICLLRPLCLKWQTNSNARLRSSTGLPKSYYCAAVLTPKRPKRSGLARSTIVCSSFFEPPCLSILRVKGTRHASDRSHLRSDSFRSRLNSNGNCFQ